MENNFVVKCPHCDNFILIEQLNCGIFRHVVTLNFEQINPHASKEDCERIQGYGCKKPFRVIFRDKEPIAEICDYI